jgi:hypothetical protein
MAPWPVRSQHDFLVQLHVSRFEGVLPDSLATVMAKRTWRATWELSLPQDGRVVARGSTDYRADGWRAGDYAGLVGLLDAGWTAWRATSCGASRASAPPRRRSPCQQRMSSRCNARRASPVLDGRNDDDYGQAGGASR